MISLGFAEPHFSIFWHS